jgi:hypothetical protein
MIATLRRFGISLWQALDRHAEPIKILSGLFVGLFVLFEYLDRQEADRVNRALDYVRIYRSQDLMEARFNYDPAINRVAGGHQLPPQLPEGQGESLQSGKVAMLDQYDAKDRQPPSEASAADRVLFAKQLRDMHTLQNFYRPVTYCAVSELCDPEVVCKNFFPDVQNFREKYTEIFADLGEDWLMSEIYSMNQFLEFCESDGSFLR